MRTPLALLVLFTGCGGPVSQQSPTTRGPRATQHLDAAHEHEARASELESWPERRAMQNPDDQLAAGSWSRSFATPQAQERAAQAHRGEAAALHAEYDDACRERPATEITISPLQRYGQGGTPTTNGVRVFLSPYVGLPDALMAEIRCHRAWMMLGPTTMDACPLDLPGLHITATGDPSGVTIEISTSDPALVPELQRRTMIDLEGAASHRTPSHK